MASDRLVDTSISVPLVLSTHPDHAAVTEWVGDHRLGLCGHAAFETFATLSRMPPPHRRTATELRLMFTKTFPITTFLGGESAAALLGALAQHGIVGGAVFDALVGAAAAEHNGTLLTRDRRALKTYNALGVNVEVAAF